MTREEWKKVEGELHGYFGRVEMFVDGYKITLTKVLDKATQKLYIAVYVNGEIRGEWLTVDCEIRRRFYYCGKKSLLTNKEKSSLEKQLGKREYKKRQKEIMEKYTYNWFSPYFGSVRTLKNHFEKNNAEIMLIKTGHDNINKV